MGVALFAPPTEVLRRRLLAGALSIAANGALLLLLILLPHRFASIERPDAIDVVFVTLPPPPQPAEAVEPDLEPVAQPEPDTPEAVAEEPVAETAEAIPPAPSTERVEASAPEVSQEQSEEEEVPAGGGGAPQRPTEFIGDAMPLPRSAVGGPQGAVRDVFCLSSSDANRDALGCPPSDGSEGLYMLQFASPENIAKGEAAFANLSGAQIRALYTGRGLPVRDLDGQSTLADPTGRMTSSADQMRDSLPPLVPDPAFGD
ncbi:hypothetical protein [Maricaulis sp.]|uniref:hypothetical protein n=1 Tax=Maricaulis sp. TaxID=1486257 RepID=UPI003296FA48